MKIKRNFALLIVLILLFTLITGCSVDNEKHLFSDWKCENIEEIQIKKAENIITVTDKNEIKQFVEYLQGAPVISEQKIGSTEGWTYAFDVKFKDGGYNSYTIENSKIRWNYDNEYQNVCTVNDDYFKPLIDFLNT